VAGTAAEAAAPNVPSANVLSSFSRWFNGVAAVAAGAADEVNPAAAASVEQVEMEGGAPVGNARATTTAALSDALFGAQAGAAGGHHASRHGAGHAR